MKYKCKRCGHEWLPRIEDKPKQCPRCKNYDWNKEQKKQNDKRIVKEERKE